MPISATPTKPDAVRAQLLEALRGGNAHADPKTTVSGLAPQHRTERPKGIPHSAWQLVEHMRLTLCDLYEFCSNPEYIAPEWPKDYWPDEGVEPSEDQWRHSVEGLHEELAKLERLVEKQETDLLAPIAWGDGQNILREVLLAVSHTSYHLGQLVLLRRLLGDWKH
jgi:hypothetical protein